MIGLLVFIACAVFFGLGTVTKNQREQIELLQRLVDLKESEDEEF
jgi:hypothetical protein